MKIISKINPAILENTKCLIIKTGAPVIKLVGGLLNCKVF